jgi:uncharacterized protein (TIGR02611 family)
MSERPKLIERLLERREKHRERHIVYRIVWGIAGSVISVAGAIMLVTPGPAFVLIPVGLAMLAVEFEWAERLLERALVQAEKARAKAAATKPWQRIAGAVLAVGALLGAAAVAVTVF